MCIVGFLIGLPYASSIGLSLLDAVDYFITNIASVFIGLAECSVAGWLQGIHQQAEYVGWPSVLFMALTYFGSLVLGMSIGVGVSSDVKWGNSIPAGIVLGVGFGVGFFFVGVIISVALIRNKPRYLGSPSTSNVLTSPPTITD